MSIEKSVINVEGMSCMHCVNGIQKAVGALPGVSLVFVDLETKSVTVEYEPGQVSLEEIKETIDDEGYEVR